MSDQQELVPISSHQPTVVDFENAISQVEACDHQLKTWQHSFKQKENVYDNYLNQCERKVKELETAILGLKLGINRILGDFEGVSEVEKAKSMEAKKSQLLQHTQDIEQEISVPINEFAEMEVTHKSPVSDTAGDSRETKDTILLAFYQSLGIKTHSITNDGELSMKLVSYHKPAICNFTFNEGDDHFINAQKIWKSIS